MADDERDSDDPGWAAPHLPPRDPASGEPAPGAPAAPPPTPPTPAPAPSAAWTQSVPAAGAVAPPGGAPRRRRGWLVVLIAVLAVMLVSVVVGTVFFVQNTLPPFNAANDFVNDLADGKLSAAAGQLCADDRNNPDRALSIVTSNFPGFDEISVNPLGVDRDGERATVDYTVSEQRGSDSIETYELTLRKEGDDWKPCPGDSVRLR